MAFIRNILDDEAVEKQKLFGLILIILYTHMGTKSFLKIASSIDDLIERYYVQTNKLGDKNLLYKAIGLNPN